MIRMLNSRGERQTNQSGFTLIEMLIVVIVLGILAMIIIPQITISTEDAKVSALQTNLAGIRSAIEIYYVQHSNVYPGQRLRTGGGVVDNVGDAQTAFVEQLTQYTTALGSVANIKTSTAKYGPYIKQMQLPTNPFNDINDVKAVMTLNITTLRTADGTTAYMIFPNIGVVFANDSIDHDGY